MRNDKEESADKAEKLIEELKEIYLSGNWRADPEKVVKVDQIRDDISKLLSDASLPLQTTHS